MQGRRQRRGGGRRPASLHRLSNLHIWRRLAGFKPECGNTVHPVAYLKFEEPKGALQNQEWAVISGLKWGSMAIPASQDMLGEQQFFR
jgi:hypothetical protein